MIPSWGADVQIAPRESRIQMRRVLPIIVVAIALVGCAPVEADPAEAGDDTAETTTTAEATTTSAASETTTTVADDEPEFELVARTPPEVFDTYASYYTFSVGVDSGTFDITGEGTWAGDAFECTMTMALGALKFSQSAAADPDQFWYDDGTGTGYRNVSVGPGSGQNVIDSCPASPLFWEDYLSPGLARPDGELVEYAGRQAIKVDLANWVEWSGNLGFIRQVRQELINEMTMWVDVETNVALGIYADVIADPQALGELGVPTDGNTDTITVIIELRIDRINDPTIAVELPTG